MRYMLAVRSSLAALLCLGAASAASADPIRITFDQRVVTAVIEANGIPLSDQTVGRDAMTAGVTSPAGEARASLTSSVANPLNWFGFGVSDVVTATQGGRVADLADASFGVQFDVAESVAFSFAAEFDSSNSQPGGRSLWRFVLVSAEAAEPRRRLLFEEGGGSAQRSLTGLLTPGAYFLGVSAENLGGPDGTGSGSGHAAFDFNFGLTPTGASPTPEPASLLLLGTGVGALFSKRARTRNRG